MIQHGREWLAWDLAYGYTSLAVISITIGFRGLWKDTDWGFPLAIFGLFCGIYAVLFWPIQIH